MNDTAQIIAAVAGLIGTITASSVAASAEVRKWKKLSTKKRRRNEKDKK